MHMYQDFGRPKKFLYRFLGILVFQIKAQFSEISLEFCSYIRFLQFNKFVESQDLFRAQFNLLGTPEVRR